jgi:hypothetical protein
MRNLLRKMILPLSLAICCVVFAFSGCEIKKTYELTTYYTVGEYSGHRVDFVKIEYKNADYSAVVVEYCVDDVYIRTLANPSLKYIVYTNDKDFLVLRAAYEEGYITHDDLLAIAEAEAPHDTLKNEGNSENIPR